MKVRIAILNRASQHETKTATEFTKEFRDEDAGLVGVIIVAPAWYVTVDRALNDATGNVEAFGTIGPLSEVDMKQIAEKFDAGGWTKEV